MFCTAFLRAELVRRAAKVKGAAVSLSSDVALLWDVKDWTKLRSLFAQGAPLSHCCFSPLGDAVVTAPAFE